MIDQYSLSSYVEVEHVFQCMDQPCNRPVRYKDPARCATHWRKAHRHKVDPAVKQAEAEERAARRAAERLAAEILAAGEELVPQGMQDIDGVLLPDAYTYDEMPVPRPGWTQYANCKGMDVNAFYPYESPSGCRVTEAKIVQLRQVAAPCMACAVRAECLQDALSRDEQGCWGGTTEVQRVELRSAALAGRSRVVNICIACDEPYLAETHEHRPTCTDCDDTRARKVKW